MGLCAGTLVLVATGGAFGQNAAMKKLNPFTGKTEAVQQGRTLWLQYGCSGCHGVMGGGGMAMPVSDDTWKFGSDDETLYKLIKGEIAAQTMPKIYRRDARRGTVEDRHLRALGVRGRQEQGELVTWPLPAQAPHRRIVPAGPVLPEGGA